MERVKQDSEARRAQQQEQAAAAGGAGDGEQGKAAAAKAAVLASVDVVQEVAADLQQVLGRVRQTIEAAQATGEETEGSAPWVRARCGLRSGAYAWGMCMCFFKDHVWSSTVACMSSGCDWGGAWPAAAGRSVAAGAAPTQGSSACWGGARVGHAFRSFIPNSCAFWAIRLCRSTHPPMHPTHRHPPMPYGLGLCRSTTASSPPTTAFVPRCWAWSTRCWRGSRSRSALGRCSSRCVCKV